MTSPSKALRDSDFWRTPVALLERVRRLGPIALDPCGTQDNWTGARHCYTEAGPRTDGSPKGTGLTVDWCELTPRPGLVFVNPPYSPGNLVEWASKIASSRGCDRLALLPANTDTRWWHDIILTSRPAVCFLRGRVRFVDPLSGRPAGCGRFASVVCYWGRRVPAFRKAWMTAGWVVQ
jgi:DNA (cytosine-5)-methyltransferase 1